jgi:hypothetical protein
VKRKRRGGSVQLEKVTFHDVLKLEENGEDGLKYQIEFIEFRLLFCL